jgi:hypothetical protein
MNGRFRLILLKGFGLVLGPQDSEPRSDWETGGMMLARYHLENASADPRAMALEDVA